MVTRIPMKKRMQRAFTLTELLIVIAIIAILAAILFPVMATVREQARQSSTMSNLYSTYVAAKLYAEDEGHYPTVLFGYAEVADNTLTPAFRPMLLGESVVPMDQLHGAFRTYAGQANDSVFKGYLYHEQIKDLNIFLNQVNPATSKSAVTIAYYPVNSPLGAGSSIDANGVLQNGNVVKWVPPDPAAPPCPRTADAELPSYAYAHPYDVNPLHPTWAAKVFYAADSLDIGPMLTQDGQVVHAVDPYDNILKVAYELHYSPDWSKQIGITCDGPRVTQLKYKNPPQDKTVLTYVTHHSAYSRRGTVIILLLNGTARKISAAQAFEQLPLTYH